MPKLPKPLHMQRCRFCKQPTYRAPQAKACLACVSPGNVARDQRQADRAAPGRVRPKRDLSAKEIRKVIAQAEARMKWERLYGSREPDDRL